MSLYEVKWSVLFAFYTVFLAASIILRELVWTTL